MYFSSTNYHTAFYRTCELNSFSKKFLETSWTYCFFFWCAWKLALPAPWRARCAKRTLIVLPYGTFDKESTQAQKIKNNQPHVYCKLFCFLALVILGVYVLSILCTLTYIIKRIVPPSRSKRHPRCAQTRQVHSKRPPRRARCPTALKKTHPGVLKNTAPRTPSKKNQYYGRNERGQKHLRTDKSPLFAERRGGGVVNK